MHRRAVGALVAAGVAAALAVPAVVLLNRDTVPAEAEQSTARPPVPQIDAPIPLADIPEIVYSENSSGRYRLAAIDPTGEGRIELTESRALAPAWASDGSALAYVSEAVGLRGTELALVVHRVGAEAQSFSMGARVIDRPAFRGVNSITFESSLETSSGAAGVTGRSELIEFDLTNSTERRLTTDDATEYGPTWSADGQRVAYVRGIPGCLSRPGEPCPQPLLIGDPAAPAIALEDRVVTHPAWSPDGTELLAAIAEAEGTAIWRIAAAGEPIAAVTAGSAADLEPSWSPDGRRFVFMRDCDLWVQDLAGGEPENITRTADVCELSPSWRPGPEAGR